MFASGKDGHHCVISMVCDVRCPKRFPAHASVRSLSFDNCERFWMEAKTKPLSVDSPFVPLRGRYCLDNSCARLEDADDYR